MQRVALGRQVGCFVNAACKNSAEEGQHGLDLIGGRRHQRIVARLTLRGGFENALREMRLGRLGGVLQRHLLHDLVERMAHDLNQLRVEIGHRKAPGDRELERCTHFLTRIL